MVVTNGYAMTRARLYVLVNAFEIDIRTSLTRYVVDVLGEAEALASSYERCSERRLQEQGPESDVPLVQYLDLREGYDLLNTHRAKLPSELAAEVLAQTANMDRLVQIRKRLMHARPLLAGDAEAAPMILAAFVTHYWPELSRMLDQLAKDPAWEPATESPVESGGLLNNLPLPDFDETGLVGRSREVAEVLELISRGREPVVTVTGEGGIGKTALALQVAFSIVDDEASRFDAVLWTSLKYERLTALGVREIAGASRDLLAASQPLGMALDASFEGTVKELAEALEGLTVLIVIDNLETLAGSEFKALYETLPPTVTYLLTSRVGVGEFERRYPLGPLSDNDAAALFNDLVRSRRLQNLMRLSGSARISLVRDLRNSPLAIKWLVLATESGQDPATLVKNQQELLEFCVRSVYNGLSPDGKAALSGLAVLSRPVTNHEMVVLLDFSLDRVAISLQELVRGALVSRETTTLGSELVTRFTLTPTATQFLKSRTLLDSTFAELVAERDLRLRKEEERRQVDEASRSLDPVVVRTRSSHDGPTASILRRALTASRDGDFQNALAEVQTAHALSPDFWEVHRVEAFVRVNCKQYAQAEQSYETAYSLSEGRHRGVVCHFYAGFLARHLSRPSDAVGYAREAVELLGGDETRLALGNYLVWCHHFDEALPLIEGAASGARGKFRLIALTSLTEAYRRWAEFARDEERNPLEQHRRGRRAFEIAIAAIEAGTVDAKMREAATNSACIALRGAIAARNGGASVAGQEAFLVNLGKSLVRLKGASRWPDLERLVLQFAALVGGTAASQLREAVLLLRADGVSGQDAETYSGEVLIGEIISVHSGYGFIRHDRFPKNVFFHSGSLAPGEHLADLRQGSLVSFVVTESDRGPQALSVSRE